MGLQPVIDTVLDQNFRYLERLIKSAKPMTVVQQGSRESNNSRSFVFNRSWVGNGLEWINNHLNVKAEPDQGISVSSSGVATKRKADYAIDCDADGLYLIVEANKGLSLSALGLAVLLEANKGLSVGASGLATKLKSAGGLAVDSDGLYISDLTGLEKSADPDAPAEGHFVIWMSDGTGKGDDGDVLIASTAGGVTNWATLFDHSAGAAW